MALRLPVVVSVTFLALSSSFAVQAQTSAVPGDAKRGHALSYTCNGCHGIPNYKNVYPTYSVPKLRGQRPEYLVAALKAYKSGERSHGTMHSQASSMTEKDMADIAVYLAGDAVLTKSESNPDIKAGQGRPKASEACVACHGTNGVGITADYPTLAGQHRDYIQRALSDYKKGGRKNPIMGGQVAALTAEDIEQLAAYYSSQTPSLDIIEVKHFFFSSN
jgi:cytochrome c553